MVIAAKDISKSDVRVRLGTVPVALDAPRRVGATWQLDDKIFLLNVPQIARFLVVNGNEIVVDVHTSSTAADAAPFLLGTAFGALLHQRGQLVLHAATVSYRGRGLSLCGVTGAGKSTLAAALCRAGCDFVGDDVAAIHFDESGLPSILPDGRQHRLWMDTAEQLALTDRLGPPVRPSINIRQFHVDPPRMAAPEPTPLSAIFILGEAASPRRLDLSPLGLADAAHLVRGEVYRSALAAHLGRDAALFGQISGLLAHIRVFSLDRPMDFTMLDETVAAVLAQCGETV